MKFKKLLASSLLCGLCIFSSIPVHASEVEGPDTGIQRTEAALTDGVTRASWGTGTLIHENPLGRIVCLESINSSATSFCDIPIFFLAFLSFSPNNIFIFSTLYSIFNIIENNISLQIRYFQNCHHFLSSTVSGSS